MGHKHKIKHERTEDLPFFGTIPGADENRAAHGGIRVRVHCHCGATRDSNVNGSHVERGPWIEPTLEK